MNRIKLCRFPRMKAIISGLIFSLLCGCGSNASIPLGQVSGTVTYNGKPLDHGNVVFTPETGHGVPATATIEKDGSYQMSISGGHQGAPLGKFLVGVKCCEKPNDKQARDMNFRPKSLIPEKYANVSKSGLRFEVKSGSNQFPIVLE